MIDLQNKDALRLFKRALFSHLMIDFKDGRRVSYLEGVEGHPVQRQAHFEDWRYCTIPAGRRSGKTIFAAAEVVYELGLPRTRSWIVAPTYDLTDRVFEYVWKWVVLDRVFEQMGMGDGSVVKSSKTKDLRLIETKWGSSVRGKSAEAPNSLIGEQLDLMVMDEAARIPEIIWTEALEPTTLDRKGRSVFISTPRGKNWFYDYFVRGMTGETRQKGWISFHMKTEDNPFIDREWLASKRAEVPEDVYRREYEASFEHFTGLVWPMYRDRHFTQGGHLFSPARDRMPPGTVIRAIDIGWRHPTYCVIGSVDRQENVWCFREYLGKPSVLHDEHAKNIAMLSTGLKVYDSWISPDAKRKAGMRKSGTSKRVEDQFSPLDIYRDNGIDCRPALDDWNVGVSIVGAYLSATLQKDPEHGKVFVSEELTHLRWALQNYVYADQIGTREKDAPERPKKYRDDAADGFRYLLATEPRHAPAWNRNEEMLNDPYVRYGWPRRPGGRKQYPSNPRPGAPYIAGLN